MKHVEYMKGPEICLKFRPQNMKGGKTRIEDAGVMLGHVKLKLTYYDSLWPYVWLL